MLESSVRQVCNKNIVQISPGHSIAEAISTMSAAHSTSVIISKNNLPIGILTARDLPRLFEQHTDFSIPVYHVMTSPVTTCHDDITLLDVLDIMLEKGIRHIPVVTDELQLTGIVSESDIMDSLGSTDLMRSQKVVEIMKSEVITVAPLAPFSEVMELFLSKKIGSLVVADARQPLGIITERDLPRLICEQILPDTPASSIMNRPVITVSVHASAQDALLRMHHSHVHHLLVTDNAGKLKGIITRSCFFHDLGRYLIRKLVSAERQVKALSLLQEEYLPTIENFYLEATENAPYGMLVYKWDTIIYANKSALHMFGHRKKHTLVGKSAAAVFNSDGFIDEVEHMLNHEPPLSSKTVHLCKQDGTAFIAEVSSAVIAYEGEAATLLTLKDITEQKELEERFRQAQKMEAVGTLAGGIAHDFNNMLAGITANIFMVKRQVTDNADIRHKLGDVENLCFKAAEIVAQLLTFSRKGDITMKPLAMVPFVKETMKLAGLVIPENIRLSTTITTEPITVMGNTTQLHQIIINLLNNARDALINTADPVIHLALDIYKPDEAFQRQHSALAPAAAYAHLSITDNGTGISDDNLEKIFEPFFTTKSEGQGTGLGLAMVYGAIQSHCGIIDAESRRNHGSTFHIYLPLLQKMKSGRRISNAGSLIEGNGEMILLVDDDAQLLSATRELLESLGYSVIVAGNGAEAVNLFELNMDNIALIIADIVMPVMGGIEAVIRMKRLKPVPALFTTGYGISQSVINDTRIDQAHVIKKPVHPSTLSRHIADLLQGKCLHGGS